MPVSFNVAAHEANSILGMVSRALSARELLAEACPPQFESAGEIRGTSFSKLEDVPGAGALVTPKSPKRFRLSKLFSGKKSVTPTSISPNRVMPDSPFSLKMLDVELPGSQLFPSPEDQVDLSGTARSKDATAPLVVKDVLPRAFVTDATAGELPIRNAPPGAPSRDTPTEEPLVKNVLPKPNGFVDTVISAYNQHHALVLRPDDVWIAILTQFNFYVNANAELLRANFVAHDGQKTLAITTAAFDDFGRLAREMVDLIEKNVVDPSLRAWALPDFSTTTVNDTTVSSIVLMATLKAYFAYVYCDVCCGIPRVTLEGEKRDWEKILGRLEKLKEYGLETIAWYHLLVPVISRFVQAFDDPNGQSNIDFWQNVAHLEPGGSGPSYYSGWISAFCAFSDRGRWLGPRINLSVESSAAPDSLTAQRFWATYGGYAEGVALDWTRFHRIDCDNIPPSYAEVDVKLVSHSTGEQQECTMTAGAIGTRVCSSKDSSLSTSGQDDTVCPVIGWWLFNKK